MAVVAEAGLVVGWLLSYLSYLHRRGDVNGCSQGLDSLGQIKPTTRDLFKTAGRLKLVR